MLVLNYLAEEGSKQSEWLSCCLSRDVEGVFALDFFFKGVFFFRDMCKTFRYNGAFPIALPDSSTALVACDGASSHVSDRSAAAHAHGAGARRWRLEREKKCRNLVIKHNT